MQEIKNYHFLLARAMRILSQKQNYDGKEPCVSS
jgi:hypothetical protein